MNAQAELDRMELRHHSELEETVANYEVQLYPIMTFENMIAMMQNELNSLRNTVSQLESTAAIKPNTSDSSAKIYNLEKRLAEGTEEAEYLRTELKTARLQEEKYKENLRNLQSDLSDMTDKVMYSCNYL